MSQKNSREAKAARREAKVNRRAARARRAQQRRDGMQDLMRKRLESMSLDELKDFADGMRRTGMYDLPPKSKMRTRKAIVEAVLATAPEVTGR